MREKNYHATITVDRSPLEVFAAINQVGKWWAGKIDGVTDQVGGEFVYRYAAMHESTQRVTELVPGKRVAWHVTRSKLSFVGNKSEWTDTDIVFDIAEKNGKTVVNFTHVGLVPKCECYGDCSGGWDMLVKQSLKKFIDTGRAPADPFAAHA